jgi:anti-sigma factor RsiW
MIEKTSASYRNYEKKITAYIDGSMEPAERTEFQAFIAIHPDFQIKIKAKEEEIEHLRSLIPVVEFTPRAQESIDYEIKQSVFNLLKRRPKNFWESLKDRYEEWISR